ncbi:class III lanthionine synthetase LanKC [Streptococcus merionis]|uniref:non-specific serine/threonine protein kinase n=1 Tax=Streptococcus merionis TaxID=400065 RepID=A0A239STG5_9STRE|nr:class III lanthionine synthetase LanKC [Streptococcus merionis]SNU88559.1 lantibiotic synthetase [Streptococcus merionis]
MENSRYLVADDDFFVDSLNNINVTEIFELLNIPKDYDCIISENKFWVYYTSKADELPLQGWKLHISVKYEESEEVLREVASYLFENRISFKHIYSKIDLLDTLSKNGNRLLSGKFITIYPQEDMLATVLENLYNILKKFTKACYVLTDRRYKDSNIFFRYGAFQRIENQGELCILDPEGNYYPDKREPFFDIPNFVNIPKCLEESINSVHSEVLENQDRFNDYIFLKSLKYTTSGGIYVAKKRSSDRKVVIKEGRSSTGFDSQKKSIIERLKSEYNVLERLKDNEYVVNSIEAFEYWENYYLVEEFITGITLTQWCTINFEYTSETDKTDYILKVRRIANELEYILSTIHEDGIGLSDLQPSNIMINDDLECRLIDFETAGDVNEKYSGLATYGFSNNDCTRKENDKKSLKKIIRYLLLPIAPIDNFDNRQHNIQDSYINHIYGKEIIRKYFSDYVGIHDRELFNYDLEDIERRLVSGIVNNVIQEDIFSYGELDAYLDSYGKINYLTGGLGMLYALHMGGANVHSYKNWIISQKDLIKKCDLGLLTGRTGIINVLYSIGEIEIADDLSRSLLEELDSFEVTSDLSLKSGVSGIVLGLLSIGNYNSEIHESIRIKTENLFIKHKFYIEEEIKKFDNLDLLTGVSGIALMLLVLFSETGNQSYYEIAILILNKMEMKLIEDVPTGVIQLTVSENRLMPYLESGSVGVSLVWYYLKYILNDNSFDEKLKKIKNNLKLITFYDGNFLSGAFGQILLLAILEEKDVPKEIMLLLNLYLVNRGETLVLPGRGAVRLSLDILTGNSGAILAIEAWKRQNPFLWLPILIKGVFKMY